MRRVNATGALVLVVACVMPAHEARADERAGDVSASASALFDRGLAAMQQSDYAHGCPLLAESARLDPRPGALFTAAECELAWGKLGSADAHYQDFLARVALMAPDQKVGQDARASIATRKRAELARRIPSLVVDLGAGTDPSVRVSRDGIALGAAALGVPLPVDPGEHEIACSAADGRTSVMKVSVPEATTTRIAVELPPAPVTAAAAKEAPEPPVTRTVGKVGIGLGVVGLGVGALFGVRAMNGASTVSDHCAGTRCDHEGKLASDQAKSSALVSTISFAAGGLALLGGGALLLFGPSAGSSSAIGPRLVGIGAVTDGTMGAFVARGGF